MKYEAVIRAVLDTPWAILPSKLRAIVGVLAIRAEGRTVDDETIAEIVGARGKMRASSGGVAVIPIMGTIAQRMSGMEESSGGASAESIGKAFDAAIADPNIGAVVLQVDSPGGSVYGINELASKIHAARGKKQIVAVADSMAASAAYWIASSADKFVVTPGGEVGSIGVISAHFDESRYLEGLGITPTITKAGKYKGEGHPFAPLDEESKGAIQKRVNEYYEQFVGAVARNRGVNTKDVRNGFGEGRVVGAYEAVKEGMADRVATMETILSELTGTGGGVRAEYDTGTERLRSRHIAQRLTLGRRMA